jgi:hypothetical protein
MKTLLVAIGILILSTPAFSQVAWHPVGKAGVNLNYMEKEVCEATEGQKCFDVAACPLDYCDLVTEFIQDPETGINIETKKLVENPEKKATFEAAQAAAQAAEAQAISDKLAACSALQGLGTAIGNLESQVPAQANTIAALRAEVNAKMALSGQILKNVKGCLK